MRRPRVASTFVLLVTLVVISSAQTAVPSASNFFRYGSGKQSLVGSPPTFRYLENVTDLRLAVPMYSITVGGRVLFDTPPEVGERFSGIQRRYLEYHPGRFDVRVGDFSELYGRGLALNLFENRGLAYNTWADGLRASYAGRSMSASVIAGIIDFRDSIVVARQERYTLYGGSVQWNPLTWIMVGGSYISAAGALEYFPINKDIRAQIPELNASVSAGPLQAYISWSRKQTTVLTDHTQSAGSGLYASLSWSGDGYGIAADYKRYRYDIRSPNGRFDYTRPTRMLPFQNPPIVQKEHVSTLLSRALREVDFNDEVGVQIESFLALTEATTMTLQTSLASRNDYYDFNATSFDFDRRRRSSSILPSLDDALSPFWESFVALEHVLESGWILRGGLARRTNTFYTDFTGPAFSHRIRSTVMPAFLNVPLAGRYSLAIQSDHEWVFDNYNGTQQRFWNQLFSVTAARSPEASLTLRYEYTSNQFELTGRRSWLSIEAGIRIGQSHSVTVSHGRERGGQICSNGVCRTLLPFSGTRVTIQSQLF